MGKIDKRQTIILMVISGLTLTFAITAAIFASFANNLNKNSFKLDAFESEVTGQVIFEGGSKIDFDTDYPLNYLIKTFTIKVSDADTSNEVLYRVYLVQNKNEFAESGMTEFKHEIINSFKTNQSDQSILGTLEPETVPSPESTKPIFVGALYGNDSHTYTYKIGIAKSGIENSAEGKRFYGTLKVEV